MSIAQQLDNAPEPEPFFFDPRSLMQKLHVDKRDWMPHKPAENCPPVIHGLVLETGTYIDMNKEPAPTLRLLSDDLATEWGVIGFHGWLKRGLNTQNPLPGDYVLLAFNGTKPASKPGESDAFTYTVLVERNPDGRVPSEEADPGDPVPDPGDKPGGEQAPPVASAEPDADIPY